MVFQFDGQKFADNFNSRYNKLSNLVKTIVLPDGRLAQMQIVITTHEDEFCNKADTMNAVLCKQTKPNEQ